MKPVVFLGPSLSVSEAQKHLDAIYLPPCAMSDVYRALDYNPTAILIVDGFFEQCPAVWHKEILYAMSQAIPVYGCSSMGALRAAELHQFGMVGLGKIFEDFAALRLEDDDEVTVVHTEKTDGYRPISEAMVNIRYALKTAAESGLLTAEQAESLVTAAKNIFYPRRNWQVVADEAKKIMDEDQHEKFCDWIFAPDCPNQKSLDAIYALKHLNKLQEEGFDFEAPDYDFEPTCYWDRVVSEFSNTTMMDDLPIQTHSIMNHVRLFSDDKNELLRDALLVSLAQKELDSMTLSKDELRTAMISFRRQRNLNSPDDLRAWMQENDVDEKGMLALIELQYKLKKYTASKTKNINQHLLDTLKINNKYGTAVSQVNEKLKQKSKSEQSHFFEDSAELQNEMLDWYQRKYGIISDSLDRHVKEQGIENVKIFMDELALEYVVNLEAENS